MGVAGGLAASDEDNISLARICVFVLEEEKIVDAVVTKGGGLDHDTERTG